MIVYIGLQILIEKTKIAIYVDNKWIYIKIFYLINKFYEFSRHSTIIQLFYLVTYVILNKILNSRAHSARGTQINIHYAQRACVHTTAMLLAIVNRIERSAQIL